VGPDVSGYRRERRQAQERRDRRGQRLAQGGARRGGHAAARTKGTYLSAQYRRLAARRGAKRAAVAVGHSILVALHQMLSTGAMYDDLGATWFDERDRRAIIRRSVQRLEGLGYKVTLETAA